MAMSEQPRFSSTVIENLRHSIHHSFQTRILLFTVGGVLFGILLSTTISLIGMNKLARDTSSEIEAGLSAATQEYLESRIEDTAERVNSWIGHSQADLRILADITQKLIDHRQEFRPLTEAVTQIHFFEDKMRYYPGGRYSQNAPDEPTVVTVQALLHDDDFQIKPYPQQIMAETAILDLIMPSIHTYGAKKTWTYFAGDEGADFLRIAPWTDFGKEALKNYPEHMDVSYWSYFPGLVEAWEGWLEHPDSTGKELSGVTAFPPTIDSATGTTIQIFGYPLWNRERTGFAGAVWYDLELSEITESIAGIELAETGFAFLALADGNVIAIPERGSQVMGLEEYLTGDGHVSRSLEDSRERDIAALALPLDDEVSFLEVQLSGKEYILMMRRLAPMNTFVDGSKKTQVEHWTLGFVVSKDEIYTPLIAAQQRIDESSRATLVGQALVLLVTVPALIGTVYYVTGRMTRGLVNLSNSARQITQGHYDTQVKIQSTDEIGQLERAFNEMARQLKHSFERIQQQNRLLRQEVRDRQEAEDALRAEKEFSDGMINAVVDTVFVFESATGKPLRWNKAFNETSAYTDDEIASKKAPDDWYSEGDLKGAAATTEKILEEGRGTVEMSLITKDGELIPTEYTASLIRDAEGNPQYVIAVGRDITERKRIEEELREHREHLEELVAERTAELNDRVVEVEQLNRAMTKLLGDLQTANYKLEETARRLEEVNQELADFAYVVSHDLKAPLRAITQLARWLSADYADALDEAGQEIVSLLISRTKRMHNLIEGILQYSRVGRVKEKKKSVDLNRVVQETIDLLAPPTQIQISVEDELPTVVGERTRLGQVFQNLLGNAIKFMDKPEGQVSVGCVDEETHWLFSVADNGPGIEEQYHAKIFQIFQTLAPRDEFESTGVGLALVKKIVEVWGGSIWVESSIGQGSTFFFTLPKRGES